MSSTLSPVRRISLVESVRNELLALLAQRSVRPGDMLPPERELITLLGVGRSSLREALAGLVVLGVLSVGTGKGYCVKSLSLPAPSLPAPLCAAQIEELFEARRILEVGIAELACARATEADFAALEACLEQIRSAHSSHRSTAAVAARFHTLLAHAAHNGLLEQQLAGIRDLMVQVGGNTERGRGSRFAEEQWEAHSSLLHILRSRDKAAMREAMLAHLDRYAAEANNP